MEQDRSHSEPVIFPPYEDLLICLRRRSYTRDRYICDGTLSAISKEFSETQKLPVEVSIGVLVTLSSLYPTKNQNDISNASLDLEETLYSCAERF